MDLDLPPPPPPPVVSMMKRAEIANDLDNIVADSDEDMSAYEDDFSVGIDLPLAAETSGNVTPIPTTGELEELRYGMMV